MNNQNQLANFPQTLVCGVDEVGRGCLAGPLISVAALFRTWDVGCRDVNDSKKLPAKKRQAVFNEILRSKELIDFGIGEVSVDEINKIGIDQANVFAFDRAIKSLPVRPNFVVIDGVKGAPGFYPNEMLVEPKADGTYPIVGAASILAKVIRDSLMSELHTAYPVYNWDSNKGYGSKVHQDALKKYGATIHHRSLFISEIISNQMEFFAEPS